MTSSSDEGLDQNISVRKIVNTSKIKCSCRKVMIQATVKSVTKQERVCDNDNKYLNSEHSYIKKSNFERVNNGGCENERLINKSPEDENMADDGSDINDTNSSSDDPSSDTDVLIEVQPGIICVKLCLYPLRCPPHNEIL